MTDAPHDDLLAVEDAMSTFGLSRFDARWLVRRCGRKEHGRYVAERSVMLDYMQKYPREFGGRSR